MDPKATENCMLKFGNESLNSDHQLLQKDFSDRCETWKKKCKFTLKPGQGNESLIFTWKRGIPHPVAEYLYLSLNKRHSFRNMN